MPTARQRVLSRTAGPALIGMEATGNPVGLSCWCKARTRPVDWGCGQDSGQLRSQAEDPQARRRPYSKAAGEAFSPPVAAGCPATRYRQLLTHRHKLVSVRTRLKTELQHLALNQGVQKKRQLWNEKGRALLASLPLQGWTQQRRKDLLQLLRGRPAPDRAAG